jgi:hypothetical protein
MYFVSAIMECFLLFVLLTRIVVDAAHFTSVNTSSGIVTGHSASMLPMHGIPRHSIRAASNWRPKIHATSYL